MWPFQQMTLKIPKLRFSGADEKAMGFVESHPAEKSQARLHTAWNILPTSYLPMHQNHGLTWR